MFAEFNYTSYTYEEKQLQATRLQYRYFMRLEFLSLQVHLILHIQ